VAEVINGGVPTDSSVLSEWNASGVTVIDNPTYGKVFQLVPAGFLNQFKYLSGTISTVTVNITYSNSDLVNIDGLFVVYNNSDNNANIALMFEPTEGGFETLSFQVTINTEEAKQVAFELTNNSTKNMFVAGISIDCGITSGSSGGINTSDYMQDAIMFGTDANKPALR
jgi:hypothetical protein